MARGVVGVMLLAFAVDARGLLGTQNLEHKVTPPPSLPERLRFEAGAISSCRTAWVTPTRNTFVWR